MEGVWKIATKAVDIAGLSDQDKREKIAAKEPVDSAEAEKKPSPLREIFANRWVSLSSSAVAAGLQIAQGLERCNKKFVVRDRKMLISGVFYLMAVSSLFADNAITESNIKKTSERGR